MTAEQPGGDQGSGKGLVQLRLEVPGMTCRSSVRAVTAHLRDVPGVTTLSANAATGELWVTGELLEEELRRELDGIGFPAAPPGPSADSCSLG